jgi:hypothetical protein
MLSNVLKVKQSKNDPHSLTGGYMTPISASIFTLPSLTLLLSSHHLLCQILLYCFPLLKTLMIILNHLNNPGKSLHLKIVSHFFQVPFTKWGNIIIVSEDINIFEGCLFSHSYHKLCFLFVENKFGSGAGSSSCNPNYSGGRDQEDRGSKLARQIVQETLSWK